MKLLPSCTRARSCASSCARAARRPACLLAIAARCSAAVWCSSSLRVHARLHVALLRVGVGDDDVVQVRDGPLVVRRARRLHHPLLVERRRHFLLRRHFVRRRVDDRLQHAAGRAVDARRDHLHPPHLRRVLPLGRRRVRLEPARHVVPRRRARLLAVQDVRRRVARLRQRVALARQEAVRRAGERPRRRARRDLAGPRRGCCPSTSERSATMSHRDSRHHARTASRGRLGGRELSLPSQTRRGCEWRLSRRASPSRPRPWPQRGAIESVLNPSVTRADGRLSGQTSLTDFRSTRARGKLTTTCQPETRARAMRCVPPD